ncbi:hypothetical protein [Enhygromyxa salina]|uniref:Uncharacterized protein n=1 Tax=Enhygromyxa salina TaxID=215803 RepID=A0A2S9YNW1_9BACT|nr:hypothetical protein [Enhygromyxa salina]PRQ06783.1 hypothetical protein ENSA7_35080 [Enhygromyxa salina]
MIFPRMIPLCLILISVACARPNGPADSSDALEPEPPASGPEEPGADGKDGGQDGLACSADVDCVPAQCCHPTTCVPASEAPDCSDIACTEECQGGTMDCGQGHCGCQDGACVAVIDNPL